MTWLGAVFLSFVAGFVWLYIKTKSKPALGVIIAIAIFIGSLFIPDVGLRVIGSLYQIPHKEYVFVIDGYKFVGYEDDFWDVFIDFYDYKNAFVSGSERRFMAYGHETDENGNVVFYDDFRNYEHLEDIHEYIDTSKCTKVEP